MAFTKAKKEANDNGPGKFSNAAGAASSDIKTRSPCSLFGNNQTLFQRAEEQPDPAIDPLCSEASALIADHMYSIKVNRARRKG